MRRKARADVVHSFISNVMQESRAVCEIPAQNVGILRQSGRGVQREGNPLAPEAPALLASMGIYLFRFAVLREVLGEDTQRQSTHDLGRAIQPGIIGWYRVAAFPFVEGIGSAPAYWRDGGTIDAYWEAYIDLLEPQADFQLSQSQEPLRTASA
jgi:ADP-glucose pyrophosphorylase